jgi:hypothetical protein
MSRLALLIGLALTLALVPAASARTHITQPPSPPTALHAWLLRADEPIAHEYSRTPSFSWAPVSTPGGHYQFQLATSPSFNDSSLVFIDDKVPFPAETISRQLPWINGDPYGYWAHVRWVSTDGGQVTKWSKAFGFDLQWSNVPQQLPAPTGLIRWSPVDGATSYQVLYLDFKPVDSFQTTTNVADEREYFSFHDDGGYGATIHWRVRAVRNLGASGATNGLPAVSYGPWTPTFSTVNPAEATTQSEPQPTDVVSDVWNKNGKATQSNELTPGFAWTPSAEQSAAIGSSLYRVYIFSDKNCVNRIYTGSVVGSPAFAPRSVGGPQTLPASLAEIKTDQKAPYAPLVPGAEGAVFDAAGAKVVANEGSASAAASSATTGTTAGSDSTPDTTTGTTAGVDLWDSGWPTGRFYWTVVPVNADADASGSIRYDDAEFTQDACTASTPGTTPDIMSFGKSTQPVVTETGKPFISGLAPTGRMIAAAGKKAVVYAQPIVAWEPTVGASKYQVEVSQKLYPWSPKWQLTTPATSLVLPMTHLETGTWYYRVRSVDNALPKGAHSMAWSTPVAVQITGNQFKVVK